jgi:hypothetical protein
LGDLVAGIFLGERKIFEAWIASSNVSFVLAGCGDEFLGKYFFSTN